MVGTTERTALGTRSEKLWEERERYLPRGIVYATQIVLERAHGAEAWDVDGKRYLDFAGGIGTLNVGHTPEEVVGAVRDQVGKLVHTSVVTLHEPYLDLARRLTEITPGNFPKKTMLVNSGAEAVENAVKMARAATGRTQVIAFANGFHGRTLLGLSLTGRDHPYKQGFGPFAPDVFHAAYPNAYRCPRQTCFHNGGEVETCPVESAEDLEWLLASRAPAGDVAAIVVEPVQGEGGFVVAPAGWLRRLREICDREGIVLIADEVQTGFGRTGQMFAVEHAGIEPDLMVLAKSLAAGLPLGAVVGKAEIMDAARPGGLGTTFGGNPVVCRAALAALDLIEQNDLLARARSIGATLFSRFRQMQHRYSLIGEVRGLGAMVAMELVRDQESKEPASDETRDILHRCHERGLIIIKAGEQDNVIRVLVPLVVTDAQLAEGLDILESSLAEVALPSVVA